MANFFVFWFYTIFLCLTKCYEGINNILWGIAEMLLGPSKTSKMESFTKKNFGYSWKQFFLHVNYVIRIKGQKEYSFLLLGNWGSEETHIISIMWKERGS